MPIFRYKCHNCSHEFDTLTKYEQSEAIPCTKCASQDTEREGFPSKPASHVVNGASAANNYGLKPGGRPSRGGRK